MVSAFALVAASLIGQYPAPQTPQKTLPPIPAKTAMTPLPPLPSKQVPVAVASPQSYAAPVAVAACGDVVVARRHRCKSRARVRCGHRSVSKFVIKERFRVRGVQGCNTCG